MAKIDSKKIQKILFNKDENQKFIDFDKYQEDFLDGTKDDYSKEIINQVESLIKSSCKKNEAILFKYFIPNLIKLIECNSTEKEETNDIILNRLVHYMIMYYDNLNIIKKINLWPYSEQNESIKTEAISIIESQIIEIEDFLNKIKYKEEVRRLLESINYDDKEYISQLNTLFKTIHYIPQKYIDIYLKEIFNNKILPSKESVENVIKSFVYNYAMDTNTCCFTEIAEIGPCVLGGYENNVITISPKQIDLLTYSDRKNKYKFMYTLFHELTHLDQDLEYEKLMLPYETMLKIEDHLLSRYLDETYSNNNYLNLYNEIDARKRGNERTKKYFEKIGFMEYKDLCRKVEHDVKIHKKDNRIYKGNEYDLDVLFDNQISEVIKSANEENIDIFKKYPVLRLLFHKDGKRVTTLELIIIKSKSSELLKKQIDTILDNKVLSKENIMKDMEELLLDNNQELENDKKKMIERFNKLLTIKERNKLLTKLKYISIILKNSILTFVGIFSELEELEAIGKKSIEEQYITLGKNKKV